jgi:hypothetical protein
MEYNIWWLQSGPISRIIIVKSGKVWGNGAKSASKYLQGAKKLRKD